MNHMKKVTKRMADLAYEKGKPVMSDAEYDKAFGKNASGQVLANSAWKKFKHTVEMYSLNKVGVIDEDNKPYFKEVIAWKKKVGDDKYCGTYKYDGTAIAIYYEEGNLVRAVTRGDGDQGEDVTRNVLKARNVLLVVPKHVTELISEIVITHSIFNKYLKDEYSNPRNGAVGALKDLKGKNAKYLTVRYHNVISTKMTSQSEKLELLKKLGAKGIWYRVTSNIGKMYLDVMGKRSELDFEIDGLVVTANSVKIQNKLGRDASGNPKYAVALKFPFQRKESTLESIEWNTGSIGTITPVAIFKEIDLGVRVTRASLANPDEIARLWGDKQPRIGDVIEVSRRGDVIPKVEVILRSGNGRVLDLKPDCPTCKSGTYRDGPMLYCSNIECDSRKLGDLYKWAQVIKDEFKVKGLGPERINQMFETGLVKTPVDLYIMTPNILMKTVEGVKEKSAANILEFQKFKEIPLNVFLGGMNIPGIGRGVFDFLIDAGYDTLDKIEAMSHHELANVENMGDIRAKLVLTWLKKKRPQMDKLFKHGITITAVENKVTSNLLEGKSFCLTGSLSKPRDHFESLIIENGGKISGVSSKLTYLVCGEKSGSKLNKAQSLGVQILSEKQLLELLK